MATAGSIVVDLLMRTGSFETDSKRAEQRMRQMQRQIDKTMQRVGMFGLAAAGAFAAAMKTASGYMAEIGMAAERTSISAEAFSKLAYAANDASLSQRELERVLRRSTEAINHGAKGGSKQAEALERLGISAYDASGKLKTADVMLRDMAEQFSKLEPGARKTGLVIDLFGQQLGQKVIPLLNQGADGMDELARRAENLGLVIDDEAAQAAIDFESNLDDLKKMAKGLAITLTQDLIPAVSSLIGQFNIAAQTKNIFGWFFTSGSEAKNPQKSIEEIDGKLKKLRSTLIAFEEAGKNSSFMSWWNKDDMVLLEAQISGLEKKRAYLASVRDSEDTPSTNLPAILVEPNPQDDKPSRTSPAHVQIDEGQRYIKQLTERMALIGKETEYEQLLAKISVDSIKFRSDADQQQALSLAKSLDMRAKEIEMESTLRDLREQQGITQRQFMRELDSVGQSKSVRELNGALAQVEDRYRAIIEARRNSPLGLSDDELEQIRASMETELEMVREFHERKMELQQDWVLGAKQAIVDYVEEAEDVFSQMNMTVAGAFKGMEDSLVSYITTGKGQFSDFANSIVSDMVRMTVRAMILAPLMRMIGFGGFSGGGLVGGALPGATAQPNGLVGIPLVGKSSGGYTGDGGKYEPAGIVHKGEYVFSKEATQRLGVGALERLHKGYANGGLVGGGGLSSRAISASRPVNINMTINTPDADSFRRSDKQLQREIGMLTQRALSRA